MVKIALGGMAALALVVTIAIGRWPSPVVAAEPDQAPFDQTWRDAAMPLAFKSAELASNITVTDITTPKVVQVETVKMVPPSAIPDRRRRWRCRTRQRRSRWRSVSSGMSSTTSASGTACTRLSPTADVRGGAGDDTK